MSPFVRVRSIEALSEFKSELARFAAEAEEALSAAEMETRRTLEWLQERLNYWQGQVRRCQEEERRAQAALRACLASGYYDEDGHYHAPDCSRYEAALARAQAQLHAAEEELRKVQQWQRTVQQEVDSYRLRAQRLTNCVRNEIPRATAALGQQIGALQAYIAISAPSAGTATDAGQPWAAVAQGTAAQASFRDAMAVQSALERGAWGERAVAREARQGGHRVLLEHRGAATTPGYDCVSWDGETLHVWEAKNYSAKETGQASLVSQFGAFDAEKRRANVAQFLSDLPSDDADRAAIVQAIQQNRVQWHVRLGPDTTSQPEALLDVEWDIVDLSWYDYDEMMQSFEPPNPSRLGPLTPPEMREGSGGGPERMG